MPITKSTVPVFASASVAPGGTKAAPGSGAGNGVSTANYGLSGLSYQITNSASAPGLPGLMVIQISADGLNWFDYQAVAGTTSASESVSGTIDIRSYVQNVRVLCYGHTTNPVTFEAILHAVAA